MSFVTNSRLENAEFVARNWDISPQIGPEKLINTLCGVVNHYCDDKTEVILNRFRENFDNELGQIGKFPNC
jgi:hypothetical protein